MHRGRHAAISVLAITLVLCLSILHRNTDDSSRLIIQPWAPGRATALGPSGLPVLHWACALMRAEALRVPMTPEEFDQVLRGWVKNRYLYNRARFTGYQPADCEDIAQEAFIKLRKINPANFEGEPALKAYAAKAVKCAAIEFMRRSKKEPATIAGGLQEFLENECALPGVVATPEDELEAEQTAELIEIGLQQLSPAQRQSVVLWHLEGREITDIATQRGVKVSTVYGNLSDGTLRLAKFLRLYRENVLGGTRHD